MDQKERLRQLLLAAQYLGPVLVLWGIKEKNGQLACECGHYDCASPGRHPRRAKEFQGKSLRERATYDPETVIRWMQQWPTQ